jgi:hypothetical protein
MSQVDTSTEPGWRPDPSGRYEWRYWDGRWTNRVANTAPAGSGAPPPAPSGAGATPAPAAAAPSSPPSAPATAVADAPADAPALTARDAVPRAPFGQDTPVTSAPAEVAPAPTRRRRRMPWVVVTDFFRSFADQPESYHSPLARAPIPADPRGEHMVSTAPGNYGHAGITAMAACGIVIGAYLPWISGTIGLTSFARSGFDDGLGLGYSIGAIALAISALLSVRMRVFRWLTVVLSFVISGFVVRDLLHTYDAMQNLNKARAVEANIGWGLWIMIVAASIAMFSAVRLSEDEKID